MTLQGADPTGGVGLTRSNFAAYSAQEIGDPLPRRALFEVTLEFERVADLTSPIAHNALSAAGFDRGDFYVDDFGQCPAVAAAGEALGWQALLAPSAAWRRPDGLSLAVFTAGKPESRAFRLVRPAARPVVAIAYLTTFRSGERPRWLDAA
jgi:hypothetical protein